MSLREPLRDGAPKAFLPKRLSSTTFLSLLLLSNLRKEPYELSPKRYVPGLLPNTLPSLSFFSSLFIADSVRSCTQAETEEKRQQKRRKALCTTLLGSYPREGPKDNGEHKVFLRNHALHDALEKKVRLLHLYTYLYAFLYARNLRTCL
jgi:hypothetical protein